MQQGGGLPDLARRAGIARDAQGEWIMDWYWWLLIAAGILILIGRWYRHRKLIARRYGNRKPAAGRDSEVSDIFQHSHDEARLADHELAKVVDVIVDLLVIPPNAAYPNLLSRDALQGCVSNFMRQAGITGMRTGTKMLHVVMSPIQITALVKLKPTEPRTAIREFIRIADDQWAFRTRQTDDMEGAIREADKDSDAIVAMLKRPAAAPAAKPAPPPPPAPAPAARRPADPAAKVAADLSAAPLARKLMNLLWIGPAQLEVLEAVAKGAYANVAVESLASDEPTPAADLFKTVARQVGEGQITADDIAWALRVDGMAGEAEDAFRRGDVLDAIERYRDALKEAPGCDVYLMSMGTCYAELGALRDAVRYLERAAQINPQNAQIARNLAGARAALKGG
jgi:Tetratricopeptide repeat